MAGGEDSSLGAEMIDADADRIPDIPIHAFDLIVADECHRGYTSKELSVWRDTLDHFDAVKVGLTATPAKHTMGVTTHLAGTASGLALRVVGTGRHG